MESLSMRPEEIESTSFRIIENEVGAHDWNTDEWQIVRRVIHTSADFEYAHSMIISDKAIDAAIAAIKGGTDIVTDTNMALSGINKNRLRPYGCKTFCYVSDIDIAETASKEGITRSVAAMRKGGASSNNAIFVIGNAPTALFELLRLIKEDLVKPALIIGLPVGFVGAEESKNALASTEHNIPFITNIGRKGGSNVAAAIVNALTIIAG